MFDDTFNNLSVIRHDNYFFVYYSKELNTFCHVLSTTETILISYTPLSIYVFGGCIYYYFNISFIFRRLVCLCCLPLWIVLFFYCPFGILQRLVLYLSNTNGDIQFNAYRQITVWMYKAENTILNVI